MLLSVLYTAISNTSLGFKIPVAAAETAAFDFLTADSQHTGLRLRSLDAGAAIQFDRDRSNSFGAEARSPTTRSPATKPADDWTFVQADYESPVLRGRRLEQQRGAEASTAEERPRRRSRSRSRSRSRQRTPGAGVEDVESGTETETDPQREAERKLADIERMMRSLERVERRGNANLDQSHTVEASAAPPRDSVRSSSDEDELQDESVNRRVALAPRMARDQPAAIPADLRRSSATSTRTGSQSDITELEQSEADNRPAQSMDSGVQELKTAHSTSKPSLFSRMTGAVGKMVAAFGGASSASQPVQAKGQAAGRPAAASQKRAGTRANESARTSDLSQPLGNFGGSTAPISGAAYSYAQPFHPALASAAAPYHPAGPVPPPNRPLTTQAPQWEAPSTHMPAGSSSVGAAAGGSRLGRIPRAQPAGYQLGRNQIAGWTWSPLPRRGPRWKHHFRDRHKPGGYLADRYR